MNDLNENDKPNATGTRTNGHAPNKGAEPFHGNESDREWFEKKGAEWPDPLPLGSSITPPSPFPMEALPPTLSTFAEDVSKSTQTKPDFAGMIGLGIVAIALRGVVDVSVRDAFPSPLRLWVATIAQSGDGKSPVFREMMPALTNWQRNYRIKQAPKISQQEVEYKRLVARAESATKRFTGLATKDAGEVDTATYRSAEADAHTAQEELDEFKRIVPLDLFNQNITPERLATVMYEQNGAAAILSGEGEIFDLLTGRYGDKVKIEETLKGWTGEASNTDRKDRKEETEHSSLNITVGAQPSVIREIMQNEKVLKKGFMARFMYSYPLPRGATTTAVHPISTKARTQYENLIASLLESTVEAEEITTLRMDAKAIKYFETVHADVEQRKLTGNLKEIKRWASKYEEHFARFAGLIAIIRAGSIKTEITLADAQAAHRLVLYAEDHARRAHELGRVTEPERVAKKILAHAHSEQFGSINHSNLTNRLNAHRGNGMPIFKDAISILETYHYVRSSEVAPVGRGKPGILYTFNPKFLDGEWSESESEYE